MIFFLRIIKILRYIFLSKYTFTFPPKKKYLIYDYNCSFLLENYISKKNIEILHTRGESINILLLIINLFKYKLSLTAYYNTYISYVRPKFIVTFTDNDEGFCKIRNFKNSKKILIQQAWRTVLDDAILSNINKKKVFNYKIDYLLMFNKHIGKKFLSFIKGKVVEIGSFKSNLIKNKSDKFVYDLLYISSGSYTEKKNKDSDIAIANYQLVKNLYKYSLKYKKVLCIYGKRITEKGALEEKSYYDSVIGSKNWVFIKNKYLLNSIKISDQSLVTIVLNSTLGYESLSRGNKVVFFSTRGNDKYDSLNFGWPYKFKKKGFFWTNDSSEYECERVINNVIKINNKKWKVLLRKVLPNLMIRDENNLKFRKICGIL